jgi:hypothetical protein
MADSISSTHPPHAASPKITQKDNVYDAEYLGSGTFKIVKPKRQSRKARKLR